MGAQTGRGTSSAGLAVPEGKAALGVNGQGTRDRGQQDRRAQKGRQQSYPSAARPCSRPPPPEVRAQARLPGGSSELGSPAPRPAAPRRGQNRAYLPRVPRSAPTEPAAAPPACGYCASQGSGHGVDLRGAGRSGPRDTSAPAPGRASVAPGEAMISP